METIAQISIIIGLFSSLIVGIDLIGHRQSMKIMNWVWVLTALWGGVLALVAYFTFGRAKSGADKPMKMEMSGMKMGDMSMGDMKMNKMVMPEMDMKKRPAWQSTTLSTLHCGAGCTLADLVGEWLLFFVPLAIGGSVLLGGAVVDYVLALVIGIYFQYVVIRAMSRLSSGQAVAKAFRADVLSLTAWQVGMYGFMAFVIFGMLDGHVPEKTGWTFWFLMQLAMLCGFIFAYPVNVLLIKRGVKKAM